MKLTFGYEFVHTWLQTEIEWIRLLLTTETAKARYAN